MIQNLKDKHAGKSIAIIGSGPTARMYREKEDIAIALNGSILLDKKIDYFMAFDCSVPNLEYYYHNKNITRLLGANIVSLDRIVYPDLMDRQRKIITGCYVNETNFHLLSNAPKSPHSYWFFKFRKEPIFDRLMTQLSASGNISFPAVEAAIIMGASRINLYGVDLSKRGYFYAPVSGNKSYDRKRPIFMNALLSLCLSNNISIGVCRGVNSRITVGESI
jgi:hypothetical protein